MLELKGEIAAGQEWKAAIGHGWVFRVAPIHPPWNPGTGKGYSGWDLIIDRDSGGGYPDAILLGTPPYGSLSEREIGTTFGLRAQDAIAWTPRRFHFVTSAQDLARSRVWYREMMSGNVASQADLLKIVAGASAGEFQVLDAKLSAGTGDPPAFAEQWAAHLEQVQHTFVPVSGTGSTRGELLWMRFAVKLWLPSGWAAPVGARLEQAKCTQ